MNKRILFLLAATQLMALPTDPAVRHGSADICISPEAMSIATSDRAIIDWSTFSIGAQEHVEFVQPSPISSVLNRVVSEAPSELMGRLSSNGQVFLINPNGVLVGQDAVIDVASLIASTFDVSNEQYLARGDMVFQGGATPIVVKGTIRSASGDVFLIGAGVEVAGSVDASGDVNAIAENSVYLTGEQLQGMYIRAERTPVDGENPYELAIGGLTKGEVRISGSMKGDAVRVLGDFPAVSGALEGGQVRIGGGNLGQVSSLPRALQTWVGRNATLLSNDVVIWGENATHFYGRIDSLQPGFAEVSSPGALFYKGLANLQGGTLLIDPSDIEIGDFSGISNPLFVPPIYNPLGALLGELDFNDLITALGLGNVTISTSLGTGGSGNITLNPAFDPAVSISWSSDNSLTLNADGNIVINGSIIATANPTSPQNLIVLNAPNGDIGIASSAVTYDLELSTVKGHIVLDANTVTVGASLNTDGIGLTAGTASNLTITAIDAIQFNQSDMATPGTLPITAEGDLTLSATNIQVNASFGADHLILMEAGGTMTLEASNRTDLYANGGAIELNATDFIATGGGLEMVSGSTSGSSVTLTAATVDIDLTGVMAMQGFADDGFATIDTTGTFEIDAEQLLISGGPGVNSYASISSTGAQTINLTSTLGLYGSSGDNSYAKVSNSSGAQLITSPTVQLNAGSAANDAYVAIEATGGSQTITASSLLEVRSGSTAGQDGAKAFVRSTSGSQTITGAVISVAADAGTGSTHNNASILSTGTEQVINLTGLLEIYGTTPGIFAEVRAENDQNITAGDIYVIGSAEISCGTPFVSSGTQNLTVTSMLLSAAETTTGANAQVKAYGTQIGDVGEYLLLLGGGVPSTSSLWSAGEGTLSVGIDIYQVGNGGSAVVEYSGPATVNVGGSWLIDSSNGANANTVFGSTTSLEIGGDLQIGTGSSTGTQALEFNGNATVNVAGSTFVLGGDTNGASSQLLHQSLYTHTAAGDIWVMGGIAPNTYAVLGNQTGNASAAADQIVAGNDFLIQGGTASGAYASVRSLKGTELAAGNNFFLTGGSALNTPAVAFVGNLYDSAPQSTIPSFTITAAADLVLDGGNTSAGDSPAFIQGALVPVTVNVGGNLLMTAGTMDDTNHVMISSVWAEPEETAVVDDETGITLNVLGNITLTNNGSGSNAYLDTLAAGIIEQALFAPALGVNPLSNNGGLQIAVGGDVTLSTSFETAEASSPYNVTVHPVEITSDASFAAGDLWSAFGNSLLIGSPLENDSGALASDDIGSILFDAAGAVEFSTVAGTISLSAAPVSTTSTASAITFGSGTNEVILTTTSGDLVVQNFDSITVDNTITTTADIDLIAFDDFFINAGGAVDAGGMLRIVVDHQEPNSPGLGGGIFYLDASATVDAGGDLHIYTADQAANTIDGLLNGNSFTPGTVGVDTLTEKWLTYFPYSGLGSPYTIFYKN
jgi:filamentous hemagglutinin family protein